MPDALIMFSSLRPRLGAGWFSGKGSIPILGAAVFFWFPYRADYFFCPVRVKDRVGANHDSTFR